MQSRLLRRVEPVFPAEMLNTEGALVLSVSIDKGGNVYNAHRVSGPEILVAPAIEAVKKWKYKPYLLNGEPVAVETTVELKFPN